MCYQVEDIIEPIPSEKKEQNQNIWEACVGKVSEMAKTI
jgi:hypothetical protein